MNKLAYEPVIVVPAFARAASLERLLGSLQRASLGSRPRIIVSLEAGADQAVIACAELFCKLMPNSKICRQETKLGLKEHILRCGDYALEYGSVIILEDDLYVDRYFYQFAQSALSYYDDQYLVSGIALYSPEFNEFSDVPFRPICNGYSTYPMQIPCSWGQAWSKSQWERFREWLIGNGGSADVQKAVIPDSVKEWPETSWKKYFAAYLAKTGTTVIYPYQSMTTNCSDAGGFHNIAGTSQLQVAMASQTRKFPSIEFCPLEPMPIAYDTFMEPSGTDLFVTLGLEKPQVSIDINGIKPISTLRSKPFVLTRRRVRSYLVRFPLSYRPVEANVLLPNAPPSEVAIFLALSEELEVDAEEWAIEQLTYYTGVNLHTGSMARRFARFIPKLILAKLRGFIARRRSNNGK